MVSFLSRILAMAVSRISTAGKLPIEEHNANSPSETNASPTSLNKKIMKLPRLNVTQVKNHRRTAIVDDVYVSFILKVLCISKRRYKKN